MIGDNELIYMIDFIHNGPFGDVRSELLADLETRWKTTPDLSTAKQAFEAYAQRGIYRGLRLVEYTPRVILESDCNKE